MRYRHLLLAWALIAGLVASPATVSASTTAASTTERPGVWSAGEGFDLAGLWRFTRGDDPAWKEPAFDDSGWEQVQVPAPWSEIGHGSYTNGYAWYRVTFDLPAVENAPRLIAAVGNIDDADEVYLNGQVIGATGAFPPAFDSTWEIPRRYVVPADAVRWGERNVLAVRVYNGGSAGWDGAGGIYRGPVGLFPRSALRAAEHRVDASPASPQQAAGVRALLATQRAAVAAGDMDRYLATLDQDYFHDGFGAARRGEQLRAWLTDVDKLRLKDTAVEVLVDGDGTLVADVIRSWHGARDGEAVTLRDPAWELLRFDADATAELGNRSRYYGDTVDSTIDGRQWDFQVYLPPSYFTEPERRFPTVYLLHGINGGPREWEWRTAGEFDRIDTRFDQLLTSPGYTEAIVVMPDGESTWYVDTEATRWRSMFVEELVPAVTASLRTIEDRTGRGITGISMGGHGAFSIAWSQQELFGSIASHAGALDLPPLAGTTQEMARNTPLTPNIMVNGLLPQFLQSYRYYFDAGTEDGFRFDLAARLMSAQLTTKLVEHEWDVRAGGHDPQFWGPAMDHSFRLHSDAFTRESAR